MPSRSTRSSGSVAMDDYLEQILHLIQEKGYARPVDVSERLGISQASVTNMLQRLDAEGLVKHEKYRGTTLTEEGDRIARAIIARHELLTEFLRLFNIDEDTIYKDVEGMEHHVSRATLEALRAVTETLRESDPFREAVLKRLGDIQECSVWIVALTSCRVGLDAGLNFHWPISK
jgi:Mn-dependent DtxR family transcriptional regulator